MVAAKIDSAVLSPEALDELRAFIHEYPDAFMQTSMKVEDIAKAGNLVNFQYNYEQNEIRRAQMWHTARSLPFFGIYVKTRQRGISTRESLRNWVLTWSGDNMRCLTVAQLETTAISLLEKMKSAYERLPPYLKMKLKHDSDEQIAFAKSMSKMWIVPVRDLAQVKDALRGKTGHRGHATEYPLWPDFRWVLSELLSMIHPVPGASLVLEATGSGRGSPAHKFFKESEQGKTPFIARFLAWQNDPSTDMDQGRWSDDEKRRRMYEVADYEYHLIERAKRYNLTVGQVWYCYKYLKDVKLGNLEAFLEDMPCDSDEAWQARGELFFDNTQIIHADDNAKKISCLKYLLKLENLENGFNNFGQLALKPDLTHESDEPNIFVYAPPVPGHEYVIGGVSTAGNIGNEPSASYVIDKGTGEMMARLRGAIKPHQHGIVLVSIGKIYNEAILGPEVRTAEGMATLSEISRLKYPRTYIWKKFDDAEQKLTNKLGWYTGTQGQNLALNLIVRVLEQSVIGILPIHRKLIKDPGLLYEMSNYGIDDSTGILGPLGDCSDTLISAFGISWIIADMETRNMSAGAMDSLRPCQIVTAGHTLGNRQSVADAIERAKLGLIQGGMTFTNEQTNRRQWWER